MGLPGWVFPASQRRLAQEVNAVLPTVPQYMDWADKPITWGKEDHPDMPTPGGYALVLDPTIKSDKYSILFTRCLVDDGSSINILYKDTLDITLDPPGPNPGRSSTASSQETLSLSDGQDPAGGVVRFKQQLSPRADLVRGRQPE